MKMQREECMARLWPLLIRITFLLTGVVSLQAYAVQGKSNSSAAARKSAIRDFAEHLSGIPVEYQADLLFSLLYQEPNALSQQLQITLLTELFERAPTAQNQTPVSEATMLRSSFSHQRVLDSSTLPLDTLDIQARTISLLRSRSPFLSWKLLQQISLPSRRTDCRDSIIPDLTPYYEVMASSLKAIKSTTVPDGRTKLAYLLQQINEIKAPAQLEAFAKSVVTLDLNSNQEVPLLEAIVSRIGAIDGSDREMFGAENPENVERLLTPAIAGLVDAEKAHDTSPLPLLLSYRAFLVRNLHATACADSTSDRTAEAASFNALDPELIGDDPKPVRALLAQELTATSFAGVAKNETLAGGEGIQEQLRRIGQIFIANQKALYQSDSMEEYLQPNPSDVQDVLKHESGLAKDDSLSDAARFENQITALHLLVVALPPGPSFKDAIDAEIALLNLNPSEQKSPLSWLRYFHELIYISRPTTVDVMTELRNRSKSGEIMITLPSPDAIFIQQTLRRYQSDPIISAYLTYEDIFHPLYVSEAEMVRSPPL
jgi:hypothetical protein